MTIEASTIATVMTDGTQRETAEEMREEEERGETEGVSMTERIELAVHMQIINVKSRGNKLPNKLVNA